MDPDVILGPEHRKLNDSYEYAGEIVERYHGHCWPYLLATAAIDDKLQEPPRVVLMVRAEPENFQKCVAEALLRASERTINDTAILLDSVRALCDASEAGEITDTIRDYIATLK